MRIGILGGTFDPIHLGHLYLAKEIRKKLFLDKLVFVPTYLPPHKTIAGITPARHRYNMVKLAIAGKKEFKVSDIEIKRKGRSYLVKTLQQLRKRYGHSREIFFITGSDSLQELDKWKNLKEILRLCKFIVVKRPRFAVKNHPAGFVVMRINAKDISSTEIRDRIKNGQSIDKIAPKKVRDYIREHRLYL